MCPGCAALRRKYGTATCPGCERDAPLDRGFCRLCRNQAMLNARSRGEFRKPDDNDRRDAARSGLQLFFAGMQRSAQLPPPMPSVPQGRAPRPGPARVWPAPVRAVQPRLVDTARDVRRARIADRPPADPELSEYARGYVEDLAARRGWSAATLERVRARVLLLVAIHGRDEPVRASTVTQLGERRLPVEPVRAVLAGLGLLDDDRDDPQRAWIEDQLDGLPDRIREETAAWIGQLRDGGPRSRPRAAGTLRLYLRTMRPFLIECAARYTTLRQVTSADLETWVTSDANSRHLRASAAGSLFRTLKVRRLVFADPARRLRPVRRHLPVPVPLPPGVEAQIGALAANDAGSRLVVALAGVHALTDSEITAVQLQDVALPERRLRVRGDARPLDTFTAEAIASYLRYRHRQWPRTANPHLLVTRLTCNGLSPADPGTVKRWLKGVATPARLRQSRLLDEAIASGGDPLILATMFGLAAQTSTRYTDATRDSPIDPGSPQPRGGDVSGKR
jgi:site-specific recombinase XerD